MIKNGLGFIIKFTLVFALLLTVNYTRAYASVYTVNDSGDSSDINPGNNVCATSTGKCTLRAAIEEANAHPGPDQINIPAMTIVLTRDLQVLYKYGFDTSVTITGAGQNKTIIDGNQRTRVLYFEARSGNHKVENLTIRNGWNLNTTSPDRWVKDGGGIFSEANLTVNNVTITNCRAYQGGGIYGEHAFNGNVPTLILNNVTLTGNQATSPDYGYAGGGGLFSGSVLTANGLTIQNNVALQGAGFYNNSIQSQTQTAQINNFTISGNIAVDGAGIDNDIGNIAFTNGVIENNIAQGCRPANPQAGIPQECVYTGGGGVYNSVGTILMTNVKIRNNAVKTPGGFGGGIFNAQYMGLSNVSISSNQAATGAGIFNGNYGSTPNSLTLINATISNNQGVSSTNPYIDSIGGGIYNISYIKLINATISYNSARYGGGFDNGNPANKAGTADIYNTIISNNTAVVSSPDCRNKIISDGHNIIGSTSGCNFITATGDLTNVNPILLPFDQVKGITSIAQNSPAIDAGTNTDCPNTDQLGTPRPQEAKCDIGTIEVVRSTSTFNIRVFIPFTKKP